jgi:tetratricopeptide (TPR) repeat protein
MRGPWAVGVVFSLWVLPAAAGQLASYGFEEDDLDSGPDTFWVYQTSKGTIRLSGEYRLSGYRSVEIHDSPGDGDNPDLQIFFPQHAAGDLFFHFAVMVTNPEETLNIAFGGPKEFHLDKDGNALWITNAQGGFSVYSNGRKVALFPTEAFRWYVFDGVYHIDRGTVDVAVYRENDTSPFLRKDGLAATNGVKGSAVNKLSFIGDAPPVYVMKDGRAESKVEGTGIDRSRTTYFVDDIVIRDDRRSDPGPLVAPGRRRLFVDRWHDSKREAAERFSCFAVATPDDLGLQPSDMEALKKGGALGPLRALLAGKRTGSRLETADAFSRRVLEGVAAWSDGCTALGNRDPGAALPLFRKAVESREESRVFQLSLLRALGELGQWVEADELAYRLSHDIPEDPRFAVTMALLALKRSDVADAARTLSDITERLREPDRFVAAEQHYFLLLWRDEAGEARRFAEKIFAGSGERGDFAAHWAMLAGDAEFYLARHDRALEWYERARALVETPQVLGRLSDAAFKLGRPEEERAFRERLYGRLVSK